MSMYESILDLVGNTPMVRLRTGMSETGPKAYVKLEFMNPTGSVKDRMALHIIRKAVRNGLLRPGDKVIDNTSGNTGASLAMVARVMNLHPVVTTPVKTSKEKIDLMRSFGAELIITPEVHHDDPESFYAVARRLARENGWFDMDQYDSQDNVEAHYLTTGPEIWEQTGGRITHFVCGIGTGGTFSGAVRYLKEQNPDIWAVAVDPEGSVFADYIRDRREVEGHAYKVEGIGSDVLTKAMHIDTVDEVITVADRDAFLRARQISTDEGISAGGSSGAVAWAMEKVAGQASTDSLIVGIFADSGIKYLSKCYSDDWMRQQGYLSKQEVKSE